MTNRIPPSLKWLADKRARLAGQITKLNSEIEIYEAVLKEKAELLREKRSDLAAIDRALGLHELQVIPDQIADVRAQSNPLRFSHGDFRKIVFLILKSAQAPMTIRDVAVAILQLRSMALDDCAVDALRDSVRYALKAMRQNGTVVRVNSRLDRWDGGLWAAGEAWKQNRIGRAPTDDQDEPQR